VDEKIRRKDENVITFLSIKTLIKFKWWPTINFFMSLEDIIEIREISKVEEVNSLLLTGNLRLLDTKIEKLGIPAGKVEVGIDQISTAFQAEGYSRYEIKYEEKLKSLYMLGRYK